MKKLFYPAIFMMNKLDFTKKMILLGGIYFVALSLLISNIYTLEIKKIHTAQHELSGVSLIKPFLKTIQNSQNHRGLSKVFLQGNKKFSKELTQKSQELALSINALGEKLPQSTLSSRAWRQIISKHKKIQDSGLKWDNEANFLVHNQLIIELQRLMIQVADKHALTLDSNFVTYYLIMTTLREMPLALEQLGQMRAYGAVVLAKKKLSKSQKIKIHSLLTTFSNAFDSLAISLGKTSQFDEQIKNKLLLAADNIYKSSENITQLIHNDILTQKFTTDSYVFFNSSTQSVNQGYDQIYQTLLPTLTTLLEIRIQQAEKNLWINLISIVLLALFAQYLFFGLYYATRGHISLLADSAYKFSHGDRFERIDLKTKDDISQLGESFNNMADSFNNLLATHLEDKERLQAILNTALDAIIQFDAQGIITGWNKQAENIFGWTADEVKGKEIHNLIISESYRQKHLNGLQRFEKTGKGNHINSRFEIKALNKQAVEFSVELSLSPIKTTKGIEFSAFIRDLRESKKTESLVRKLSLAVEQSPNSILITDKKANIEYANKAFLESTGYALDEILGKNPRILSANKTNSDTFDNMWKKLDNGDIWQGELINKRKDGSEYTDLTLISPVRQENGEITHYLAIKEDVTEKKAAEIEQSIASIAFEAQDGIMVTGVNNQILRVNSSFSKITGYSSEDVLGKNPSFLKSNRHRSNFYSKIWAEIEITGSWHGEIWNRHKEGHTYLERVTITARRDENNKITHHVAIFNDITESKRAQDKIRELAYFDHLTKLPNRRKLLDNLKNSIKTCRKEEKKLALLMLDLDKFKDVNDSFGHLAGDELLKEVAKRIKKCLHKSDLVARLGGDEFVVLLQNTPNSDDSARIAQEIIDSLAKPFHLTVTREIQIGTSIGISLYPEHANSVALLLDHADMALYQAKDKGRGCYSYFSRDLTRIVRERLKLEEQLRKAIKEKSLEVYYQPQVDVTTGKIIGAEALIRWETAENQFIPPNKFIPIAEETGLILELGEWILQQVCQQGKQWLEQGIPDITLAVNVSSQQFKRSNVHDLVKKILDATDFPARNLELEMTESGLMEQNKDVVEVLEKLRTLGILLAIDDFGTGYSSLAYLKQFPLDTLKIDKSFIDDIPSDKDAMEIAKTINDMGHALGFKVLAEGLENKNQLEFLQQIGCDSYQGYYKSKALKASEFSKLLKEKLA